MLYLKNNQRFYHFEKLHLIVQHLSFSSLRFYQLEAHKELHDTLHS